MRYTALLAMSVAMLAACSQDTTSIATGSGAGASDAAVLASFGDSAWAGGIGVDGPGGFGHLAGRLRDLPDSLALTDAQQTQIKTLMDSFRTANQADLDSLRAIHARAHAAREAGASRDSVHTILGGGDAVRQRLEAAEQQLVAQIRAVLTDAQRAWLAANAPQRCDPTAAPLSDEQRAQIDSLVTAFRTANAADLATVRQAMEQAHAARRAGVSQDSITAILAGAQPAMERLRAARDELQTQIRTLLTPEQIAAGCFLGPGHGGHDGGERHGGDRPRDGGGDGAGARM